MKKIILFALLALLVGCGARKAAVQKTELEAKSVITETAKLQETITETVVTEIDTVVTVPGKVVQAEASAAEVLAGTPMVYEDADIRSETRYEAATGTLVNKTTVKPKTVPVKQKETAHRTISRDVRYEKEMELDIKAKEKAKVTEREGVRGILMLGGVLGVLALAAVLWVWFWLRRKNRQLPEKKEV